jgi:hypothetical protein
MRRVAGRSAAGAAGAAMLAAVGASLALADPSDLTAPVITRDVLGTVGDDGWFRGPVNVRWTVSDPESAWSTSGCDARTFTEETAGFTVECRATSLGGTSSNGMVIKIDTTAPSATAAVPDRPPDRPPWYRAPVSIAFIGDDALSGVVACSASGYAGPDAGDASVTGACRDRAGNESARRTFQLGYDSTGPIVLRARRGRRPDHGRWYRRAVKVRFRARDPLSGGARCEPVIYRGPDGPGTVRATCSDYAGNVTTRDFPIRFDATPPTVALRAKPGGRMAVLRWRAAPDARSFQLSRWIRGRRSTRRVVYRGARHRHVDRGLTDGLRYRYALRATDRAGRHGRDRTRVKPHRGLLAPRADAQVTVPPLLRWTPVLGARYYNVQLVRDGRTILSDYPRGPRYAVPAAWTFKRQTETLAPGIYTWYVWAAKRRRSEGVYGRRIGHRRFVVAPAG